MLEKYFKDHDFKCMISCYGFGYNLLSELLMNLSDISGGDGYSFIPDSSLLGNIFIHGISNFLTTAAFGSEMKIVLEDGITFDNNSNEKLINISNKLKLEGINVILLGEPLHISNFTPWLERIC